jgi:hypothetical protein
VTHICQKAIFKHTPESAFPGTQRINEDRKGFQSGQQFRRTREQQAVSASPGSVFQEIITEGEAGRSLWNCQEYPKEEENPMNEQQLRYIHAIEREESIQKASSSLGKSPSTVARVVKNCENELGAVLFRRVGRKMILTPEGVWKLAVACPKEGKIPKSSRGFLRLLTETLGQMSVSGSLYFTEQAFHYMISNSSEGNVSKLRDRETQPGKRGEKPSERVCGF